MAVDLVIFDCDGVLVDSEPISVRVGTAAVRRLGWTIDEAEYAARFVGCTKEYWAEQIGETPPGWRERLDAEYVAAVTAELRTIEGIEDVLDRLEVPSCVASNGRHATIRRSLELTGLARHFDGRVFSAEDVARGKPAPDLFLHAAATMGAAPERCVVVEDSPFGVTAAVTAGMRCLAFAGGLTPAERLAGLGATLFHHPAALLGLIDSLV
ncbi:HAD family hydrolase [Nonomuraea jiangxiensis]|uniref:Haloacid dehalogenase superfamily, subfamily IA, variant 3 with third motif having DD or ED n=1 Tax=Nonomuraea jiangxiensis TaxID=633440 RepID=A0A1G8CRI2_9ACTN|nr:HAD family hydrolase [Nonomuraea jiangxiensis]SDH48121.1 haloacid dehalogenase superfamily, subfamily IA, variant 3 with third motif having DD or ED [Nonomuraea jiangxiensis]